MRNERSSPPAWLPDWKDADAYSEFTTRADLAWQFLRRNTEYQADWIMYESVPYYWPDHGGKTPKGSGRSFQPSAEMIYYWADPPGHPYETLEEYERRMQDTDYEVTNLESGLCKRWGIMLLKPPEEPFGQLIPYDEEFPVVGGNEDVLVIRHHNLPEPYKIVPNGYLFGKYQPPIRAIASIYSADHKALDNPPNVVPIWFSLDHNLKAQIDDALAALKELRDDLDEKNTGYLTAPSVDTLITAIRVHDARLSGAKHADIQAALDRLGPLNTAGTTRDTSRDMKLAKEMIESGYRKLIRMD